MNWYTAAKENEAEIKDLRHKIHQDPELGNQEFHTRDRIVSFLHAHGIEAETLLDTAVLASVHGAEQGRTIMIRADIDALPIQEETDLPYASKNGAMMHACGHDMHTAMALGAAKILQEHREEFCGTVKFIFQPDEEGEGGAQRLIKENILQDVDAVFGLHVNPDLPVGTIGIKYGAFYAAAGKFDITVHGSASHGAEPEKGINALSAGAAMVSEIQKMNGSLNGERIVTTVGTFHAGTVRNILCDKAELSGIVRTFGQDRREKAHQHLQQILQKVDEAYGTKTELHWADGYCGIWNPEPETELIEKTARQMFPDGVILLREPTMTTEDFGFYLAERPGCFYQLGVQSEYPLHHPKFNPREEALAYGTAMHCAAAAAYLKNK